VKSIYVYSIMRRKIRRYAKLRTRFYVCTEWLGVDYSRTLWQHVVTVSELRAVLDARGEE